MLRRARIKVRRQPFVWIGAATLALLLVAGALALLSGALERDAATADVGSRATVWAVGDGADGGEEAKAVANMIAERGLDRLIYLGDVYEDGTAEDFDLRYEPVYGRFRELTAPTPGNHDWPQHEEGYDPYWREALGRALSDHYSFDIGGWQILSVNSEAAREDPSEQLAWLREELAGPGNCRLAFWHRARFSAGTVHGDHPYMEPFWDALTGKASIVVNGHEHNMQRFEPIDGLTEFVSGAGGHEQYPLVSDDPRLAFGNDTDYGALRLDLEPGVATFAFVSQDGRTLDSGVIPCEP